MDVQAPICISFTNEGTAEARPGRPASAAVLGALQAAYEPLDREKGTMVTWSLSAFSIWLARMGCGSISLMIPLVGRGVNDSSAWCKHKET